MRHSSQISAHPERAPTQIPGCPAERLMHARLRVQSMQIARNTCTSSSPHPHSQQSLARARCTVIGRRVAVCRTTPLRAPRSSIAPSEHHSITVGVRASERRCVARPLCSSQHQNRHRPAPHSGPGSGISIIRKTIFIYTTRMRCICAGFWRACIMHERNYAYDYMHMFVVCGHVLAGRFWSNGSVAGWRRCVELRLRCVRLLYNGQICLLIFRPLSAMCVHVFNPRARRVPRSRSSGPM